MSILSNLLFYLVGMWLHKLIFILDFTDHQTARSNHQKVRTGSNLRQKRSDDFSKASLALTLSAKRIIPPMFPVML